MSDFTFKFPRQQRQMYIDRGIIKDVAADTGVSKMTVVRTFRNEVRSPNLEVVRSLWKHIARIDQTNRETVDAIDQMRQQIAEVA